MIPEIYSKDAETSIHSYADQFDKNRAIFQPTEEPPDVSPVCQQPASYEPPTSLIQLVENRFDITIEEAALVLLTLFFRTKITQSCLSTISKCFSIMVPVEIPSSFDECARILVGSVKKKNYETKWYCGKCNRYFNKSRNQRRCLFCSKRLNFSSLTFELKLIVFFFLGSMHFIICPFSHRYKTSSIQTLHSL